MDASCVYYYSNIHKRKENDSLKKHEVLAFSTVLRVDLPLAFYSSCGSVSTIIECILTVLSELDRHCLKVAYSFVIMYSVVGAVM